MLSIWVRFLVQYSLEKLVTLMVVAVVLPGHFFSDPLKSNLMLKIKNSSKFGSFLNFLLGGP